MQVLGMLCAMVAAALINSVGMPLLLEALVLHHPQAHMLYHTPTPGPLVLWGLKSPRTGGEDLMTR